MKRLFAIILILAVTITALTACADDRQEEPPYEFSREANADYAEVTRLGTALAELENYALDYYDGDKESAFQGWLTYIRKERYYDGTWALSAGYLDTDFAAYVDARKSAAVTELLTYGNFMLTEDDFTYPVDFIHMLAVVNMILRTGDNKAIADLGGWAGDIGQLVQDIMNEEGTVDELYLKAKALYNTEVPGGFDAEDVYADLDAVILYTRYMNGTATFAATFTEFYKTVTLKGRIEEYYEDDFGEYYDTKDELRQVVYNRVSNNLFIKTLLNTYHCSDKPDHLKACCYVYADYLFENLE